MRETWVWSLGWEDPLEEEMVTYSSILAWRIPWTEEPGGLPSIGLQRVGHDWVTERTHTQWHWAWERNHLKFQVSHPLSMVTCCSPPWSHFSITWMVIRKDVNVWPCPQRLRFQGLCRATLISFQSTWVILRDCQIPGLEDVEAPFPALAMIQADLDSPFLDHHILQAFRIFWIGFHWTKHYDVIIILYICIAHYCLRK